MSEKNLVGDCEECVNFTKNSGECIGWDMDCKLFVPKEDSYYDRFERCEDCRELMEEKNEFG